MKKLIITLIVLLALTGCDIVGTDYNREVTDGVHVRTFDRHVEYLGDGNEFFEIEYVTDWHLQIIHVISDGGIEIITYDQDKKRLQTLLSRSNSYGGLLGLNFKDDPKYMQVIADDKWDISQHPLGAAPDRIMEEGDEIRFTGDNIVLLNYEFDEPIEVNIRTTRHVDLTAWGSERKIDIRSGKFTVYPDELALEFRTEGEVYLW